MKKWLFACFALCCSFSFSQSNKKLLIIGIDGCRSDVITKQFAPTLDSIVHLPNTAYTFKMKNELHTISAPNWTSMLTGVHCFRHRALRNNFNHCKIDKYPHFYKHLHDYDSSLKLISLPEWELLNKCVVNSNAYNAPLNKLTQQEVTSMFLDELQKPADSVADASFIYYDEVDHAGHKNGYGPKRPGYLDAVKGIDADIQKVLAAVQERKEKYKEDWLVIISTDHGGRNNKWLYGHGIGLFNRKIRRVFLIMNGNDTNPGKIKHAHTVDVAITALHYFQVPIQHAWKLQGKAVGLK